MRGVMVEIKGGRSTDHQLNQVQDLGLKQL